MTLSKPATIKAISALTIFALVSIVMAVKFNQSSARSNENAEDISLADGAVIYANTCARCHGADGRAQTAKGKQTGATDLTSGKWQPNDARDTRLVNNGKGKMPGFKGTLSDEEIKAVLMYVRRFKS